MLSIIVSKGYVFKVTHNKKYQGPPRCEYPKQKHQYFRSMCRTFPENGVTREIFYPKELWGTYTMDNCPIENEIIDIKNTIYDWQKIEILNFFDDPFKNC